MGLDGWVDILHAEERILVMWGEGIRGFVCVGRDCDY